MARTASAAFLSAAKSEARQHCVKVLIQYADGTSQTLTDLTDFMGIKIDDSCSDSSKFVIGSAIINEAVIRLNNREGKFTGKDFFGAKIDVKVGFVIDGTPEYVDMGSYLVDEPVSPGISISLTAYDRMILLDQPFDSSKIVWPASLASIAESVCDQCDVILFSKDFPNASYSVSEAPEDGHTCREILAAVAQIAGCFARVNGSGEIEIAWYSDTVSHAITEVRSKTICTDDVTITGIVVSSGSGSSEVEASSGKDGYKLSVKNNILIESGKEQTCADYLAGRLVGLTFRPLKITVQGDPTVEAGDKITVTDETGATYSSLVTHAVYQVLDAQTIECNAESPTVNSSSRLSEAAAAVIKARKYTDTLIKDEQSARETAVQNLADSLAASSGMYTTTETQDDGSVKYYIHDRPKKSESTVIVELSSEALAMSKDGGKTWPYAIDFSGNAILNKIYAIGLDASYINSGELSVKTSDGTVVMYINAETGQVYFNAAKVTFSSGETIQKYIDSKAAAISVSTQYYSSTSSTELTGGSWSDDQTAQTAGHYIWTRTKTTKSDGTITYSEAACISGESGQDAITLVIDSTNGNLFKNSDIATILTVTVITGDLTITDSTALKSRFGDSAHLTWKMKEMGADEWTEIDSSSDKLNDGGFLLTISAKDIDTKCQFSCELDA